YLNNKLKDGKPITADDLAHDAGYKDFRSFQVMQHTVPMSDKDQQDLAKYLKDNPDFVKQIAPDGKLTLDKINSINQNLGDNKGGYKDDQLAALGKLDGSFNRLASNGTLDLNEFQKKATGDASNPPSTTDTAAADQKAKEAAAKALF